MRSASNATELPLAERNCLITGASRGLGAALAEAFWAGGFNLFLVAQDAARLTEFANRLPGIAGQRVHIFAADLSKIGAVADVIGNFQSQFTQIDVLINNAAIQGPIGPAWSASAEDFGRAIQVNMLAPIALCRGLIPSMIEKKAGCIINLSGGGATGPRPNFSAYATAKAGLIRFGETLAEEVKSFGITVNAISPGAMKTAMLAEVLETGAEVTGDREFSIASHVFAEGGASMEAVTRLALFLADQRSNTITGKLISAVWDDWEKWPDHLEELAGSDVYTLRRIVGRDRGFTWGDR